MLPSKSPSGAILIAPCYLSETSEAVQDLPLEEIYRRIDRIHAHYGPATDVQVTGGDPTLPRRDELLAIVAQLRERGAPAPGSSVPTSGSALVFDIQAEKAIQSGCKLCWRSVYTR